MSGPNSRGTVVKRKVKNEEKFFVRPNGNENPELSAEFSPSWGGGSDAKQDGVPVEFKVAGDKAVDVRRFPAAPRRVRQLLYDHGTTHPGLILERYAFRWTKGAQIKATLLRAIDASKKLPSGLDFASLLARHQAMISATARRGQRAEITATTTGPLTLHLSRASSMENVGICLHPVHGFVYLPGSGIKGTSRAWAEFVWFPTQLDPKPLLKFAKTGEKLSQGHPPSEANTDQAAEDLRRDVRQLLTADIDLKKLLLSPSPHEGESGDESNGRPSGSPASVSETEPAPATESEATSTGDLPTEADRQAAIREALKAVRAWRLIECVFGRAPGSDSRKSWKPVWLEKFASKLARLKEYSDRSWLSPPAASQGAVTFHDAWPQQTHPPLQLDIVNNHHTKYYGGEDWPGDWEDPKPVNFLSVGAGGKFQFHLTARTSDDCFPSKAGEDQANDATRRPLTQLAAEWLAGSLCYLGTGAKTRTGYGRFQIDAVQHFTAPSPAGNELTDEAAINAINQNAAATWNDSRSPYVSEEFELELVTPAFLAGALQGKDDCDLREATLKPLLRWWWRTMHAGFLDQHQLLALENALWGSTKGGSAIEIDIKRVETDENSGNRRTYFDKRTISRTARLPRPQKHSSGRVTPQGLSYGSYGMDDAGRRRAYVPTGVRWQVRVSARKTEVQVKIQNEMRLIAFTAGHVLEQACSSLMLLSRLGGIGAKSRKGFGSLNDVSVKKYPNEALDVFLTRCRNEAQQLRKQCGQIADHSPGLCAIPSLEQLVDGGIAIGRIKVDSTPNRPVPVDGKIWHIVEQVGGFVRDFMNQDGIKHNPDKYVFGLPRQIHGPGESAMSHQTSWNKPVKLHEPLSVERLGSPWLLHIVEMSPNEFEVRLTAFVTDQVQPSSNQNRIEPDSVRQVATGMLCEMVKAFRKSFCGPGHASFVRVTPRENSVTCKSNETPEQLAQAACESGEALEIELLPRTGSKKQDRRAVCNAIGAEGKVMSIDTQLNAELRRLPEGAMLFAKIVNIGNDETDCTFEVSELEQ